MCQETSIEGWKLEKTERNKPRVKHAHTAVDQRWLQSINILMEWLYKHMNTFLPVGPSTIDRVNINWVN